MTFRIVACAMAGLMVAGCGGGGGSDGSGGPGGGPSVTYLPLSDTQTATSPLVGGILTFGSSSAAVSGTTGTITHNTQTFTATGVTGAPTLGMTSDFEVMSSNYTYARDIEIPGGPVAVIGVGTAAADMPTSGSANYVGEFEGEALLSGSTLVTPLINWTADVQVSFGGSGTVAATFTGGGSTAVDTITFAGVPLSGNAFDGTGTLTASRDVGGTPVAVTTFGNDVNVAGGLFGYDNTLTQPDEVGGVISASDGGNEVYGVFIAD